MMYRLTAKNKRFWSLLILLLPEKIVKNYSYRRITCISLYPLSFFANPPFKCEVWYLGEENVSSWRLSSNWNKCYWICLLIYCSLANRVDLFKQCIMNMEICISIEHHWSIIFKGNFDQMAAQKIRETSFPLKFKDLISNSKILLISDRPIKICINKSPKYFLSSRP